MKGFRNEINKFTVAVEKISPFSLSPPLLFPKSQPEKKRWS